MALKQEVQFAGKDFPDAYHRIKDGLVLHGNDSNNGLTTITLSTEIYFSNIERDAGSDPFISKIVYQAIELTEEEKEQVLTICYGALKRDPFFKDSIDV